MHARIQRRKTGKLPGSCAFPPSLSKICNFRRFPSLLKPLTYLNKKKPHKLASLSVSLSQCSASRSDHRARRPTSPAPPVTRRTRRRRRLSSGRGRTSPSTSSPSSPSSASSSSSSSPATPPPSLIRQSWLPPSLLALSRPEWIRVRRSSAAAR